LENAQGTYQSEIGARRNQRWQQQHPRPPANPQERNDALFYPGGGGLFGR